MKLSAPIFLLKAQAKLIARETKMPLYAALDQVARSEGFRSWSHLSAAVSDHRPAREVLSKLRPGDLLLLAARPGHGKTLLGLQLALEAGRSHRSSFFFTVVYSEEEILGILRMLGTDRSEIEDQLIVDTSDHICAEYIIDRVGHEARGAVMVIDYLQVLDQRRSNADLDPQIRSLKLFAATTESVIVILSQIDRGFKHIGKELPRLADIRLPNPLDLTLFTKSCFMRNGEAHLQEMA